MSLYLFVFVSQCLKALPKRPEPSIFDNIMLDGKGYKEVEYGKAYDAENIESLINCKITHQQRKLFSLRLGIFITSPCSVCQTTSNCSAIHSLSLTTMKQVIAVSAINDVKNSIFRLTDKINLQTLKTVAYLAA